MKKMLILLLTAAFALSLAACGGKDLPAQTDTPAQETTDTPAAGTDNTQIPNPFTELASKEEAETLVGFDLRTPDLSGGDAVYRVDKDGKLIELLYTSGEDELRFRKAEGTGDISGDYNDYPTVVTTEVDGSSVTMKGENETFFLAIWENDGYTYSVYTSAGVNSDTMNVLVSSVS